MKILMLASFFFWVISLFIEIKVFMRRFSVEERKDRVEICEKFLEDGNTSFLGLLFLVVEGALFFLGEKRMFYFVSYVGFLFFLFCIFSSFIDLLRLRKRKI